MLDIVEKYPGAQLIAKSWRLKHEQSYSPSNPVETEESGKIQPISKGVSEENQVEIPKVVGSEVPRESEGPEARPEGYNEELGF